MKWLLARIGLPKAIGVYVDEDTITLSRIVATPLGPIEIARQSETFEEENLGVLVTSDVPAEDDAIVAGDRGTGEPLDPLGLEGHLPGPAGLFPQLHPPDLGYPRDVREEADVLSVRE